MSLSALLVAWVGASYVALLLNLWLPLVSVGMAFCGAGLTAAFFDRSDRLELEQRRKAVDLTYGRVALVLSPAATLLSKVRFDSLMSILKQPKDQVVVNVLSYPTMLSGANQLEISSTETVEPRFVNPSEGL